MVKEGKIVMKEGISIGIQDFEKIRKNHCFYVDKTSFIKEWWDAKDDVTLITRPRRFGKTLNISMMECFFSNRYKERSDLFKGLFIWEYEEYRELQGTYPVISLSFASVKEKSYTETIYKIFQIITQLYNEFSFLTEGDLLNEKEKAYYQSIDEYMTETTASMAVHSLCIYLSRYYGKKVIILLDEYDTPMQEAYVHGYWEDLVSFTRTLFNATFKTNPYMERAIMTGITRVSKESIFSDLNNLEVITTTSEKYRDCFGFTENEVFQALEQFDLSKERDEVKHWYDGFTFGEQSDIYNPWSIINYLDKKKFQPYWANTSSNSLVGKLIQEGSPDIKKTMEDLLVGKTLVTEIDEQIVFNQLDYDRRAIWSLLLASGYLKVVNLTFNKARNRYSYELVLTNNEVLFMFQNMIDGWFSSRTENYSEFITMLMQNDIEGMNYYMNEISLQMFSYFDTGTQPSARSHPEKFYHGFVLGLMVELRNRYVITSNRESGFDRYDIMMEPLHGEDDAIVIEFKVFNPQKEQSLSDTLTSALAQIEEKQYEQTLVAKGIQKQRIRKYGFAFEGKNVLIG